MDALTIVLIILIPLLPIVALIFIRPDGRFHCHISGCNESFDSLEELVIHLKNDHNVKYDEQEIYCCE